MMPTNITKGEFMSTFFIVWIVLGILSYFLQAITSTDEEWTMEDHIGYLISGIIGGPIALIARF